MLILAGAAFVYYRLIYAPAHAVRGVVEYVLPQTLDVMDTTAEVRSVIGHLKAGDRVQVVAQTAHWSELKLRAGQTGWVENKYLLDGAIYDRGIKLLDDLQRHPPQAAGHASNETNLHLEPARDAIVLAELPQNQPLEIYARRLVDRPAEIEASATETRAHPPRDVWYLVKTNFRAGWVLGRFIDLDIPAGISLYAEGINMVGWQVLRTVRDGSTDVPEYLVADRIGSETVDFNHIRVFTWWIKNHKYVTAYVQSDLNGYFPIEVEHTTDLHYYAQPSPYFRLRLIDDDGQRYQEVYGLFDTIVRPVGRVDGWDSAAMPEPPPKKEQREVRARPRARRRRR
ncbi:MAG TPA: SH3 domain-containing protein [Terriglobia bacterium]|nr:SH3 domain-containing protein [Terriglobia bacterium]